MKHILLVALASLLLLLPGCSCWVVDDELQFGLIEEACHGDLMPCANDTYGIGSPASWFADAYIVDLHAGSITGNVTGQEIVSATLVVAAVNSVDPDRADYQCSGANDDVEINAALVAGAGGSIALLEGDYASAANVLVPANTVLKGQGMGTAIAWNGAAVTNCIVLNGDYAWLQDMTITVSAGCGAAGSRPNVIFANGQSRLLLENLYLYGDKTVGNDGSTLRQNGICFSNVDYSKVINCEATNNQWNGIRLASDSNYNVIEHGIYTSNSKDGLILDTSHNNRVLSCTCNSNTEYGLHLKSADNNIIEGNTCALNTRSGIYTLAASENSYVDNVLKDNVQQGLQLLGGDYNIVDSNSAIGNDSGASGLYSGLYVSANNMAIVGNTCTDNGLHGIRLYRGSYCTVVGNVCGEQVVGDGIHVFGDSTTNADYNTIVGNVCYNNGDDGLAIEGGANTNRNLVDGNQLTGNAGTNYVDNGVNTLSGDNQIL